MKYSELIIEHFENPQNVGEFNQEEEGVLTGKIGALNISDIIQLQLKINAEQTVIAVKFKAYGNPYTIAGLSWLTTELKGKTLAEAKTIDYLLIANHMGFPKNKLHSALLIADVLSAAISDYQKIINVGE